ncbi:signal recognition particle-docking protein FtsY [Thauera sp.]|jgi:fused signal recognition particle receptor|uniref:signal recognition particle-docking protein FtsY n=1 Tax=Thauera sp. TaxID=1905334 RepID=UPI002A366D49|nr:signal recognition particle-docking protein FtsY [Thauera sp.]MDX9885829.1 signal recognition particle-docking protein FtsY [Thauera sp.]
MFGFLKKKFGKSDEAAKAAEDPHAPEQGDAGGDAGVAAPASPPVESEPAPAAAADRTLAAEAEALDEAAAAAPLAPVADAASAPTVEPEREVAPAPQPESVVEALAAPESRSAPAPELVPGLVAPAAAPKKSWTDRLKAGLARTRQQLGGGLASLFGLRKIDEDLLEELESTLLMADCGVDATQHLIDDLRRRWKRDHLETADQLQQALADGLHEIIAPLEEPLSIEGHQPFIIMIAGVNGSGKTTSIGKLAKYFQAQGKSVLLAAGDTFRAAAREQLMTWGERNNVTVVAQDGGDSAAVIFDAINAARARKIDVVLADTAGRLPTQLHLMEEIAKVRRVVAKADPTGPHEVLLVLDANIGQNALTQVKAFDKAIGVTGLVVTKLDGTAKGGVLAAIARQCPKPLRFIGVGEGIDDLQPFKAREFVDALFEPGAAAVKTGAGKRA